MRCVAELYKKQATRVTRFFPQHLLLWVVEVIDFFDDV